MDYWVSQGYGLKFSAAQVGGSEKLWVTGGYGLRGRQRRLYSHQEMPRFDKDNYVDDRSLVSIVKLYEI